MATVDNSYEVALASKLQMILDQPMSDLMTKLVNHDYEGDFFKIGDTVSIVKPDPDSVTITKSTVNSTAGGTPTSVVGQASNLDLRGTPTELDFSKTTLRIDSSMKYAFYISDVNKVEGQWNYESQALDVAARKMRIEHNLDTAALIAADANVPRLGTPAAPIAVDKDTFYEKIAVPMFTTLYNNGAISPDAQFTYGSNPEEQKRTAAGFFCPAEIFGLLLQSKYLTDRSTTQADDKVETAAIKQLLGMDVAIEPALSQDSERHITVNSIKNNNTYVVIAGTANCVTQAGKVLKPDKMRSESRYGDNYYGLEIYGRKLVQPKAAVVAFVEVGAAGA